MRQLQMHQRKLALLRDRSVSAPHDASSSISQPAVQAQVAELRQEVERLREMMTNMDMTPPPQYHD
jgi:hypothetical protein